MQNEDNKLEECEFLNTRNSWPQEYKKRLEECKASKKADLVTKLMENHKDMCVHDV